MRARPISCCFSGHRPGKLPWGDDEGDRRCLALKERLWNEMEAAYEQGYRHFICGMAQGCDLYFCELALALRQLHGDVTVKILLILQLKGKPSWLIMCYYPIFPLLFKSIKRLMP